MNATNILSLEGVCKAYQSGEQTLTVLDNVSLSIPRGQTCALVGPSGSGKTTLLGLCAGLDTPTSGSIVLDGVTMSEQSEAELASLRNERIGFVFQSFQLIPSLTALENVMVPAELAGTKDVAGRAQQLIAEVGLGARAHHYPSQLSGGEQQRIAIARAFINEPAILFADEPTGNLDDSTAQHIESLLFSLNEKAGTTLVIATHNMSLAEQTQRTIRVHAGSLEG